MRINTTFVKSIFSNIVIYICLPVFTCKLARELKHLMSHFLGRMSQILNYRKIIKASIVIS